MNNPRVRFHKTQRSADGGTGDFTEQELRRWAVEQAIAWRDAASNGGTTTAEMMEKFYEFASA